MIRLTQIHKQFGHNPVLKGIDLALESGTVTALIGPSGSGKSTLLRCVNLLEIPQHGSVEVGEHRIDFDHRGQHSRHAVQALRRQTGMVFQNFQLFPHRTVIENVMEGLVTVQKVPKAEARVRAMSLLEKVGMAHKADAWPATLSGGQQQRVAIARALAPQPQVLLCDEPTSALDPELAGEVVEVLRQLAQEGMTMLMATHDLRLAANIAQHVVFLEDGQVIESGSPQALFGQPQHPRTVDFVSTLTGAQQLPQQA
ncbi:MULTISPECIES: amino acid ABC transporter ATP-binding protein [unclassified Paludibacterium]|uniref:amino acid ABC transporter ATP-binding protein n=1 Tax=unclassified Paludibacterium TaxID=2618429 RepID=UPI001C04A20F|nr:amino acid ABC transporter ATP-binding protein [Paludibacterium sp. B53371]BEV72665.1 amino acid ABC transporter ATP-binding protein [Paludibacterium sp. THUN1379]